MGKSSDFPAVTALGLYDRGADHVRHEAAIATPAKSAPGDTSAARGIVSPTLNQQSTVVPAYRRSLFRQ